MRPTWVAILDAAADSAGRLLPQLGLQSVRVSIESGRKSSKCVQCGEPNFNTLKTLDRKEAARVKPFVFKFES
jgi:hypothetical protein